MIPLEALTALETRVPRYALVAAVVALVAAGGLGAYSCRKSNVKAAAMTQADTFAKSAAVQAARGKAYDEQEKEQAKRTQESTRRVQADASAVQVASDALARVRRAAGGSDPAAPAPGNPDATLPVSSTVGLAPVVSAQDVLIHALQRENGDLKTLVANQAAEIKTLTLSRDAWKGSANASAQEAVQVRAALAAQEGLLRAAEIKYGLGGFLLGYGAGRAHR